jgi:hypothetical protein
MLVIHSKEKTMKTKFIISLLVALMLIALQVGVAAAAPAAQDPTPVEETTGCTTTETPTDGTVTTTDTTTTGDTTTEEDTSGEEETPTEGEEANHPVADALSQFFCDTLGTDYDTIIGFHDDGYGFGVIAQALWAANELGVDPADVLAAKTSGDYSAFTLPDGSTPTNWGQFRKALSKHTLGEIMSGKAEPLTSDTGEAVTAASGETTHGQGHVHGHGGGKGKGHNK